MYCLLQQLLMRIELRPICIARHYGSASILGPATAVFLESAVHVNRLTFGFLSNSKPSMNTALRDITQ